MGDRSQQKTLTAIVAGVLAAILTWSLLHSMSSDDTSVPATPPISTTPVIEIPAVSDTPDSETRTHRTLDITPREKTPGDNSDDPIVRKGKELMHALKFKEAQTLFYNQAGTSSIADYYSGMLAAYFGDTDTAQAHFQNVIARNDDSELSGTAQRFLDAYVLFSTYQDGPPEFLDTLISREFLAAGELELGIDKLRFVTSNNPSYTDAWILLGSGYLVREDYTAALESFKHGLPSSKPESYYWVGNAYLYEENPQKALAAFKEAERKGFPDVYKIKEKMGDSYVLLKQYRSAVKSYEEALELESQYPDLYVRPVWIYIDLLDTPDAALRLAKQAQQLFPNNALAHNLTGWSYLALEDYPRAKIALDRALALDDKLAAAHLNIGAYYEATNNTDVALEHYERAVDLDGDGPVGQRAQDAFRSLVESSSA